MKPLYKLTKLSNNANNVRTTETIGYCDDLPEVGRSFILVAQSLDQSIADQGGFRQITTSIIKEVDKEKGIFKTQNSTYQLVSHDSN